MFYSGPAADEVTDDHEGYVAGRYANDALSDIWTDISRLDPGTFLGYRPACECGWRGDERPADPAGYRDCQRAWMREHFAGSVAPQRRSVLGARFPARCEETHFDWGGGFQRLVATAARTVRAAS